MKTSMCCISHTHITFQRIWLLIWDDQVFKCLFTIVEAWMDSRIKLLLTNKAQWSIHFFIFSIFIHSIFTCVNWSLLANIGGCFFSAYVDIRRFIELMSKQKIKISQLNQILELNFLKPKIRMNFWRYIPSKCWNFEKSVNFISTHTLISSPPILFIVVSRKNGCI